MNTGIDGHPGPHGPVAGTVPPVLQHVVRSIGSIRTPRVRRYERILPQPTIHLVVNLSDPYRIVRSGAATVDIPVTGAFVSALQRHALVTDDPPLLWNCAAEIEPFALGAFTEFAPVDLVGRVLPAGAMIPAAQRWPDELRAAGSTSMDRFGQLLARALRPEWEQDDLIVQACRAIDADPHRPIADLSAALGVPAGRLLSRFRAACGIPPKAYADLVRFHRFVSTFPFETPVPSWSQIAVENGYYDQPHFIRSFRRCSSANGSASGRSTPDTRRSRTRRWVPSSARYRDERPGLHVAAFLR